MKLVLTGDVTSQTVNIFIQDSSVTTGAGLTGLAFNTGSLSAYYVRPRAAAVAIPLVTLAAVTTAWASGGFKEIDSTNMPGWYRLDIPNAAIASGVSAVGVHLFGAANMAPCTLEVQLDAAVQLNPAQALANSQVAQTVGECLIAARSQAFGRWTLIGTTLTLYASDGTTALKVLTVDSASAPTSRT